MSQNQQRNYFKRKIDIYYYTVALGGIITTNISTNEEC